MCAPLEKCAFVGNIHFKIRRLQIFSEAVQVLVSAEMSFVGFFQVDVCSVNFVQLFVRDTNVR